MPVWIPTLNYVLYFTFYLGLDLPSVLANEYMSHTAEKHVLWQSGQRLKMTYISFSFCFYLIDLGTVCIGGK